MVRKSLVGRDYPDQCGLIVDVLHRSQGYMRRRKDECSFVSLRDVERTLIVLTWFLDVNRAQILHEVNGRLGNDNEEQFFQMSAILALGVTFYARLEKREEYVTNASQWLKVTPEYFCSVIKQCQAVFIDEMRLENTVAKNDALMENIWMMAICIGNVLLKLFSFVFSLFLFIIEHVIVLTFQNLGFLCSWLENQEALKAWRRLQSSMRCKASIHTQNCSKNSRKSTAFRFNAHH